MTPIWRPLKFKVIVTSHAESERIFDMTTSLLRPDGSKFNGFPGYKGMHVSGALGMTLTVDMNMPSENEGTFCLEICVDSEVSFKLPMIVTHRRRKELLSEMVGELIHPMRGHLAVEVPPPKQL